MREPRQHLINPIRARLDVDPAVGRDPQQLVERPHVQVQVHAAIVAGTRPPVRSAGQGG
jgi:hypothetical protein